MAPTIPSFAELSSEDLLLAIPRLVAHERHATASLVAALAVMEERQIHVAQGYSSVFAYCTRRLHLSEAAACRRIDAARVCRRYAIVLERLVEGRVTLAAISALANHLTDDNYVAVLDAACHRSKREVEELVARLAPRPDLPSSIRKLPQPRIRCPEVTDRGGDGPTGGPALTRAAAAERGVSRAPEVASFPSVGVAETTLSDAVSVAAPAGRVDGGGRGDQRVATECALFAGDGRAEAAAPSAPALVRPVATKPALIRPLAPGRYQVTVTVSGETHAKLLRAGDLLRHAIPSGDPALVIDRALTVLLKELERAKFALRPPKGERPPTPGRVNSDRRATTTRLRRKLVAGAVHHAASAPGALDATAFGGVPDDVSVAERLDGRPPRRRRHAASPIAATCQPAEGLEAPPAGRSIEHTLNEVPRAANDSGAGHRAGAATPASRSRYIPARVRREVWTRSGGQCEFVSEEGHRCEDRSRLEFHHRVPFAVGGVSTVTNVSIRCTAHNEHEAEVFFGSAHVRVRRLSRAPGQGQPQTDQRSPITSAAAVDGRRDSRGERPLLLERRE